MPAGTSIPMTIPPSYMPVFIMANVVWIAISFVAILIAFDARDRGMTKPVAIVWFLAVQLFPPAALAYLLIRNLTGKTPMFKLRSGAEKKTKRYCPYCAAPVEGEEKICRGCGRLL